jgi:hypothetical protein
VECPVYQASTRECSPLLQSCARAMMWRACHVTLMMWRMPRRGSTSCLTFDTRLASGLSWARQKVRICTVQRIGLCQLVEAINRINRCGRSWGNEIRDVLVLHKDSRVHNFTLVDAVSKIIESLGESRRPSKDGDVAGSLEDLARMVRMIDADLAKTYSQLNLRRRGRAGRVPHPHQSRSTCHLPSWMLAVSV